VYRHSVMLTEIERRFRGGQIRSSDCEALKTLIINSGDESNLESAIYIFGRSCPFDTHVLDVCLLHILERPKPGLTAACMRTAFDYWGRWDANRDVLAGYIDMNRYDDWYDEVIFASRFCANLSKTRATDFFDSRLNVLKKNALKNGNVELLELIGVDN
jgi:hypothetical protein